MADSMDRTGIEVSSAPVGGHRRFGGTIPVGADALLATAARLDPTLLYFSHGRAALRWIVGARGPFAGALVCAYTWPTVPDLLTSLGLEVRTFDVGDPDPTRLIPAGNTRWLVLVPALFGVEPWLDLGALARALGSRAMVVLDAAQTAFAAIDHAPPPGGGVFSCLHKCTALGDGALLALDPPPRSDERQALEQSPMAIESSKTRLKARIAFARGNEEGEIQALELIREAEALWPLNFCRMTDESKSLLAYLDRSAHGTRRRANGARLTKALNGRLPFAWTGEGVPFCQTILVAARATLLPRLHARRVFASPLWPDAHCDAGRHPRAARFARELIALPLDQRYEPADMDALADLVLDAL